MPKWYLGSSFSKSYGKSSLIISSLTEGQGECEDSCAGKTFTGAHVQKCNSVHSSDTLSSEPPGKSVHSYSSKISPDAKNINYYCVKL